MPGATFYPTPSGIPGPAQQPSTGGSPAAGTPPSGGASTTAFLFWLAIFGVVIPVVILGGLNAGKFRFVYVGK